MATYAMGFIWMEINEVCALTGHIVCPAHIFLALILRYHKVNILHCPMLQP